MGNRFQYRAKVAMEDKKRKVADLMARGIYVKAVIARTLDLPYSTASRHVDEVYAEWREEHKSDVDDAVRRQLREIVWQRNELQEQWEKSKQDAVTVTEKTGGKEEETVRSAKGQCADARYSAELRELRAEERDLLGVTKLLKGTDKPPVVDEKDPATMTEEELLEEYVEIANASKGGESK